MGKQNLQKVFAAVLLEEGAVYALFCVFAEDDGADAPGGGSRGLVLRLRQGWGSFASSPRTWKLVNQR